MKASERQRQVALFREGITDVLVGTTVLEVGVDVPEATLIVVVAADRFGITLAGVPLDAFAWGLDSI